MNKDFDAQSVEEPVEEEISGCKCCGNPEAEEGYTTPLCRKCRDKLSKHPIPIQIKAAAAVLVIVMVISLVKFPRSIKAGIEYEKGLKAEEIAFYFSAKEHFNNVLKEYPNSDKVLVKLITAYYKNEQIDEAYNTYKILAGNSPKDKKISKDLAREVNSVMDKVDLYYYPSKELHDKLKQLQNPSYEQIASTVKPFVDKNKKEVYGAYILADSYFELKKYSEANEVLSKVLAEYPDFTSGQILKASALRELGKYDEAAQAAKQVLDYNNSEDVGAILALSKIELKRKNNEKGLDYALEAAYFEEKNPYVILNLALAYHYNNKIEDRDEEFKKFKTLKGDDKETIDFYNSIFNGTLQWQK